MGKSIVFLDFDGVLCDSIKEAYLLARYAYFGTNVHDSIDAASYTKFCDNRYLVSNSWQYYYLMLILDNNDSVCNQKFTNLTKNDKADDFNKKFLSMRKYLMENEYDFWNVLEEPTSFFKQAATLIHNTKNCTFSILSTKNKEAILAKFKYWGLEFNPSFIFEKKDLEGISKGLFINDFLMRNQIYEHAILIDDNEDNIKSCDGIKHLTGILTAWGYNTKPKFARDEDEIIKIIKEIV